METSKQERGRSAVVVYGTETGTSQDLAEEIGRCLERIHIQTDVLGLDAVSYSRLSSYSLTVFVIATTGQGDFPENARKFWTSLLRRKLSSTTLAGIDYALVGLGDTSYPKFNWAARKLDKRLHQLGATSLIDPCEADEQGEEGTEGAFLAWLQRFRETVLTTFPLANGREPIPSDVLLPSKWRLEQSHETVGEDNTRQITNGARPPLPSDTLQVNLENNDRVTPSNHWQDVRFISFKASRRVEYMPGDALAISPQNMSADVDFLISRMNWQHIADTPIRLVSARPSSNSNLALLTTNPILSRKELTLRILLTEYLDINAIPRRSFLGTIANYTSDSMHKERLLEFTDPQYLDEYFDYATRPRRSILEILQEFDSVYLPWEEATNIFPPMRPRQFSIASGGILKQTDDGGTRFELLVAIVKYRTVIKRIREGVCTRYLAQLPVGTSLQVSLKTEGRFSNSSDAAVKNHLLLGAGTGIAPLRALIYEKAAQGHMLGKTALFFGCRNEHADFFFRDEWDAIMATQASNNGLEVITAFSRDQRAKIYLQDRIRERSGLVWDFLRARKATVIVCGSSGQMPKAVRQALVDALAQHGRENEGRKAPRDEDGNDDDETEEPIEGENDAERYLARLEKEGRYKQETW